MASENNWGAFLDAMKNPPANCGKGGRSNRGGGGGRGKSTENPRRNSPQRGSGGSGRGDQRHDHNGHSLPSRQHVPALPSSSRISPPRRRESPLRRRESPSRRQKSPVPPRCLSPPKARMSPRGGHHHRSPLRTANRASPRRLSSPPKTHGISPRRTSSKEALKQSEETITASILRRTPPPPFTHQRSASPSPPPPPRMAAREIARRISPPPRRISPPPRRISPKRVDRDFNSSSGARRSPVRSSSANVRKSPLPVSRYSSNVYVSETSRRSPPIFTSSAAIRKSSPSRHNSPLRRDTSSSDPPPKYLSQREGLLFPSAAPSASSFVIPSQSGYPRDPKVAAIAAEESFKRRQQLSSSAFVSAPLEDYQLYNNVSARLPPPDFVHASREHSPNATNYQERSSNAHYSSSTNSLVLQKLPKRDTSPSFVHKMHELPPPIQHNQQHEQTSSISKAHHKRKSSPFSDNSSSTVGTSPASTPHTVVARDTPSLARSSSSSSSSSRSGSPMNMDKKMASIVDAVHEWSSEIPQPELYALLRHFCRSCGKKTGNHVTLRPGIKSLPNVLKVLVDELSEGIFCQTGSENHKVDSSENIVIVDDEVNEKRTAARRVSKIKRHFNEDSEGEISDGEGSSSSSAGDSELQEEEKKKAKTLRRKTAREHKRRAPPSFSQHKQSRHHHKHHHHHRSKRHKH